MLLLKYECFIIVNLKRTLGVHFSSYYKILCELFNVDFPPTVDCIVESRGELVVSLSQNMDSKIKSSQKRRKSYV